MCPSPFMGEAGARPRSGWEGEGTGPCRKELLVRARWMRTHPTEAEKRLWTMLRDRRLSAFKFRRQQVIQPFIVDFVCFERRLIVEADGSQHADNENDIRRDAFLREHGFQILRFWNNQVLREGDAVMTAILASLSMPDPTQTPAGGPPPPPHWGGVF